MPPGVRSHPRATMACASARASAAVPVDLCGADRGRACRSLPAIPHRSQCSYLNQPVDIEIIGGADGKFHPGDLVVFYAEPYAGRYQNDNVYRFTWNDPDPRRMQTRAVSPAPATRAGQRHHADAPRRGRRCLLQHLSSPA